MHSDSMGINRRVFLRYGILAGLSTLASASLPRMSWSASKERLTILSSIALDTLHPYAISASPHYGIWQHMIEPLVEIDYAKKQYYGVLAESWDSTASSMRNREPAILRNVSRFCSRRAVS